MEEFELDLDHVVEALAPLVDVVVAAATAVHFAGGLSPISECRITVVVSSKSCNTPLSQHISRLLTCGCSANARDELHLLL